MIGRDGKVYLGDQQGNRRAFYPNGAASWTRNLRAWCTINASPVVDADGTIDVVGARVLRDHRDGQRRPLWGSALCRVHPGGALRSTTRFPVRLADTAFESCGFVHAAPNIWRSGSEAAVVIPARDKRPSATDLRLLAFSPSGTFPSDVEVTSMRFATTGG